MNGTLNNAGSSVWTNTGPIGVANGALFNNLGSLDVQGDATFYLVNVGGPQAFNNIGTFTKTGGLGATLFDHVHFINEGFVSAASGLINFNGGYQQTAGNLHLGGGSVVSSTALTIFGGAISGSGD